MGVAVITGSAGLVGSEAVTRFAALGLDVVGLDNDMRQVFFGKSGSTVSNVGRLRSALGSQYVHDDLDIRDRQAVDKLFHCYGRAISVVVHTAAQPSHDWAARQPLVDFDINAVGTLNILDATRRHCPEAVFIFTSTNKVYGDRPNQLPFVELDTRWDLEPGHTYGQGIREDMSVDTSLHSVFGASKLAADVLVQEYGRYFGMRTACFRCGTLSGPQHAAVELHGFLGYVMHCVMTGTPYRVFGYKGKQVRDVLHASDLVAAFEAFFAAPRTAEVYNMGGGRHSHCSVLEAIDLCSGIAGVELSWSYDDRNRVGDHIWWVGDNGRFAQHYPGWRLEYDLHAIAKDIHEANADRWGR
jgi:CDP-paratose 2-epimerase